VRNITVVLRVFVAFISPLFLSCGSDNDVDPMYDLRALSQLYEDFGSAPNNTSARMNHKKISGHSFLLSGHDITPRIPRALAQGSSYKSETYTYEYGDNAHLYWIKATGTDDLGSIIATATQTLDDAGFPTRCMWYDGAGNFDRAYDYTYDKTLYLRTSIICYIDDPTDNSDARKDYESLTIWNKDGVLATGTRIEYDSSGIKTYEYKWRSTSLKNSLRGAGGFGYLEYYKEYEEGLLTYQDRTTFDSDGYPQTYSIDNNGDGIYDETYHSEITKTIEGYLKSVVWIEDGTGDKKSKETFAYDEEGLLKTTKEYNMVDDEFVLETITTDVWYKNPVNGPTGGLNVWYESDEEGNPLGEYETVDWTATQKTYHYYSSTGEEAIRTTDSLEKIRLPF
jgi:hypothetical protein